MAQNVVKEIRKATRRRFSAEQKIQIVLEGLRGEITVSELCRREGIHPTVYYKWSRSFLDSGKNGLTRDVQRDATSDEVRRLKEENDQLKKAVAEGALEVQKLKKVWVCNATKVCPNETNRQTGCPARGGGVTPARASGPAPARYPLLDLLSVAQTVPPGRNPGPGGSTAS